MNGWFGPLPCPLRRTSGYFACESTNLAMPQTVVRRLHAYRHRLSTSSMRHIAGAGDETPLEEVLLWCAQVNPLAESRLDPRLRQAMDAIAAQPAKAVSVAAVAARPSQPVAVSSFVCASIGLTPQQWIETQRMNRARQLLEMTVLPIKQIASECGYDDPLYFSRRFAVNQGCSPRTYRGKQLPPAGSDRL